MSQVARHCRAGFIVAVTAATFGCAAYEIPDEPFDSPAPYSPYAKSGGPAPPYGPNAAAARRDDANAPTASPSTPVTPAATTSAPAPDQSNAAALQQVMTELQSLGNVDPATQRQLLADLEQTDPALWPVMMQTFRAGLAYRQKQADSKLHREQPSATPAAPAVASTPVLPASPDAMPRLPNLAELSSSASPRLDMFGGASGSGGSTAGLSMPTNALLSAALADAQRQIQTDQASNASPPSATMRTATPPAAATSSEPKPSGGTTTNTLSASPDWRTSLEAAITQLQPSTQEPPHSSADVARHAWLRVLCLAAGRREEALRPIPGIAAAEQDFWSEQIYALSTYLDAEKLTDPALRSAEARRHLAKAEMRLAEAGNLTVRNLAFCTEVSSFGVYEKFKETSFKPGQPLILYAEVDNFKSEETDKGFHTALRSSYQILDAQGRRVAENDLALTEEYCRNRRRDYFIRYFLSVPERIYAGKYVLQLTIVDTLSQKIGQTTIDFTVGDEAK